jgi:FkbM family methyltransferase
MGQGGQLIHDHLSRLSRKGPQTFLLIGANDGVTDDHLYPFVIRHGWKGTAVEPVPQYFHELQKHYNGWPVTCLNAAVHATAESLDFWFLEDTPEDPLPPYAKGVGSFERSQVESLIGEIPRLNERLRCMKVPCSPLGRMLGGADPKKVDVIIIDTEGYDAEVVRQIDFTAWNPNTVIFEHKLLPKAELAATLDLLRENGYNCDVGASDVLAWR